MAGLDLDGNIEEGMVIETTDTIEINYCELGYNVQCCNCGGCKDREDFGERAGMLSTFIFSDD